MLLSFSTAQDASTRHAFSTTQKSKSALRTARVRVGEAWPRRTLDAAAADLAQHTGPLAEEGSRRHLDAFKNTGQFKKRGLKNSKRLVFLTKRVYIWPSPGEITVLLNASICPQMRQGHVRCLGMSH